MDSSDPDPVVEACASHLFLFRMITVNLDQMQILIL